MRKLAESAKSRFLAIVNPVSGTRDREEKLTLFDAAFARAGANGVILETAPDGDRSKWVDAARNSSAVLVGGGDGTLLDVVETLVRADVDTPVGHVPFGTANVIAKTLGLPDDPEVALDELIGSPRVLSVDLGRAVEADRYFLVMAAAGFPADIVEGAPRELKTNFGGLAYLLGAAKNVGTLLDPADVVMRIPGQPEQRFASSAIFVLNFGPLHGFGAEMMRTAHPQDGRLTVCAFSGENPALLLVSAFDALAGNETESDGITFLQAPALELEFSRPLAWQYDGELDEPRTMLHLECVPRATNLLVGSTLEVPPPSA